MCLVKKPKPVVIQREDDNKERPILRNPLLDGLGPLMRARMGGTRALRIDRGTTRRPVITPINPTRPTTPPGPPTSGGGGGDGRTGPSPEQRETLMKVAPLLGLPGLAIRRTLEKAQ